MRAVLSDYLGDVNIKQDIPLLLPFTANVQKFSLDVLVTFKAIYFVPQYPSPRITWEPPAWNKYPAATGLPW